MPELKTMSGEVCAMAQAAEARELGVARKKSDDWCIEWLMRITNFLRHLSRMERGESNIDWLVTENVLSQKELDKIQKANIKNGCIERKTISKLAEQFNFIDSQDFMNAAIRTISIDFESAIKSISSLNKENQKFDAELRRVSDSMPRD
jgi:hypothetical protein